MVESFAPDKEILARPGQVISRPELADLMAASKMYLSQRLQNHAAQLNDGCYDVYLLDYFPVQLSKPFKQHLAEHPLTNEIKATVISNLIINQAGCSFLTLANGNDNGNSLDAVNCYLAFDQILHADSIREAIGLLDNQVPSDLQYQLLGRLENTLVGFVRWMLAHGRVIRPEPNVIARYRNHLTGYQNYLAQNLPVDWQEQLDHYQQTQMSLPLAQDMVFIAHSHDFPFVVSLLEGTGQAIEKIMALVNDINGQLGLNEVRRQIAGIPLRDGWEKKVAKDLYADLQFHTGQLVSKIIAVPTDCFGYFAHHADQRQTKYYEKLLLEIKNTQPVSLLPYVCLVRSLGKMFESR